MRKKLFLILIAALLVAAAIVGYVYLIKPDNVDAPQNNASSMAPGTKNTPEPTPEPEPAIPFNKSQYSLDDPNSIWVVVNKSRPLPSNFAPTDLVDAGGGLMRSEAAAALNTLLSSARTAGVPMSVLSAYRSYSNQQSTYQGWVDRDGQAQADNYSARPGHSEHQTGLAVDLGNGVCDLEICFGNTPAGQWLAQNAHNYGFIIRYQNGKQGITGYQYEPWHIRYVGEELAAELQKSGQTMEEFFGLPAAPNY